jgi:hypothetical protein
MGVMMIMTMLRMTIMVPTSTSNTLTRLTLRLQRPPQLRRQITPRPQLPQCRHTKKKQDQYTRFSHFELKTQTFIENTKQNQNKKTQTHELLYMLPAPIAQDSK